MPQRSSAPALTVPPPPVLPWAQFDAQSRREVEQGMHQLFVGPTQSGKTVLCRLLARNRDYVVAWGTKKKDTSLDAYVDEGYIRIDEWPRNGKPSSQLVRKTGANGKTRLVRKFYKFEPDSEGKIRFLLWPEIQELSDIPKHSDTFRRCLSSIYGLGGWSIVMDETLVAVDRLGLNLDRHIALLASQGASNKVTLYLCMQRPSGLARLTWASVSDAYVFKSGVTDDVRELAALGTVPPKDAEWVLRNQIKGHQFLHLPTRGQSAGWSISEVDPSVI